jgi:hypothetical protein
MLAAALILFGYGFVALVIDHQDVAARLEGCFSVAISVIVGIAAIPDDPRAAPGTASQADLDVLRELAKAVRKQWVDELRALEVDAPYPLPVRWEPAGQELVDSWSVLEKKVSDDERWPAAEYLDADRDDRWASALDGLPPDAPLRSALSSPLLVSLARTVCNPPPGELTEEALDPRRVPRHRDPDDQRDLALHSPVRPRGAAARHRGGNRDRCRRRPAALAGAREQRRLFPWPPPRGLREWSRRSWRLPFGRPRQAPPLHAPAQRG